MALIVFKWPEIVSMGIISWGLFRGGRWLFRRGVSLDKESKLSI